MSISFTFLCLFKYGSPKVIELQPQFDDVHVIFQEATEKKPEMYVIIAASYPYPVVVTVCRTMDEVWEYCNGFLKRRKKK